MRSQRKRKREIGREVFHFIRSYIMIKYGTNYGTRCLIVGVRVK